MIYTDNEVDLLQLTWKGSDDEDSPFDLTEIKWRGEVVPFVMGVDWKSDNESVVVTLTVTNRKGRGHAADEPIPLWEKMKEAGIRFVSHPDGGDPF